MNLAVFLNSHGQLGLLACTVVLSEKNHSVIKAQANISLGNFGNVLFFLLK